MTLPLRVLLVAPRGWPATGGIERHLEDLAAGLAERSVEVTLAVTDPTGRLPRRDRHGGFDILRFPTLRGNATFYVSQALGRWLIGHADGYDVIHGHSYHTPIAVSAAIAARLARRPLVITPHYHGTGHTRGRAWLHRPYRPLGGWMLRQARKVIAVSSVEEALLRADFGASLPTTVIPHGVDVAAIQAADSFAEEQGDLIVTGGRLEPYKQVDRVIATLVELPTTWRLVVTGDGPARTDLEALSRRLGLGDRCRFVGWVSDADLRRWYRTASVFVSLSRHEAFGLTALESAAAGASVVLSAIPAHREVARSIPAERVVTVEPDSTPSIIAERLMAISRAGGSVGGAAWTPPSLETMVEKTLDLYRKILEPRAPGISRSAP